MIRMTRTVKDLEVIINLYNENHNIVAYIETNLKDLISGSYPNDKVYMLAHKEVTDIDKIYRLFSESAYFKIKSNNTIVSKLLESEYINIDSIVVEPNKVKVTTEEIEEIGEDGNKRIKTVTNIEDVYNLPEGPSNTIYSEKIYKENNK